MLSDADRDLYHVAGDPQVAEALMMTPREAASAVQVAAEVRSKILAGEYDATGRAPSRAELAAKQPKGYGISLANASVVLRMLAAEGWVTLDQGRGSFLRPRRLFEVDVAIPRPAGRPWGEDESPALEAAIAKVAEGNPAVMATTTRTGPGGAEVSLEVTAATSARAADVAESVILSVADEDWPWDGWDLPGASVTARPA